jgi:hypothetical protein
MRAFVPVICSTVLGVGAGPRPETRARNAAFCAGVLDSILCSSRTVLQTVLHERKSPQLLQQQLCSAYSAAAASAVSVPLAELLR